MSAKSKLVCQVCGAALGGGGEVCPVCALRGALGPEKGRLESVKISLDPRNIVLIHHLADTSLLFRQFDACEKGYDRLIELLPDRPILRAEKTLVVMMKAGDDGPAKSALAALPASMTGDLNVLDFRLNFALDDRDWRQAKEIIEKFKGDEESNQFAYAAHPVPIGCFSILIGRLQGERPGSNPEFAKVREQLNQKIQKSPESAGFLSQLAVVDALLGNKEAAISEAKRAFEMLPISKDAMERPFMVTNLAVVYAWTDEIELAFETLAPLTKTPAGVQYGQLKDPYCEPLRKDPRFDKLLAELAPKE